ncbi:MAG: phage minor head protein, partial [Woeseiaceae bacterium]
STGEAKLSRVLTRLSTKHRKRLRAAIAQYGTIRAIPREFWDQMQAEINEESATALLLIMIAAHQSTQNRLRFRVSGGNVEGIAAGVTKPQAAQLARQMLDNTRDRLLQLEAKLRLDPQIDEKKFRDELAKSVAVVISDERAGGAAVTETTRAISSGQRLGGDDYAARYPEVVLTERWLTERDERVCPICAPLHGKKSDVWAAQFPSGPPAHPNCRCELLMTAEGGKRRKGRLEELGRGQGESQ